MRTVSDIIRILHLKKIRCKTMEERTDVLQKLYELQESYSGAFVRYGATTCDKYVDIFRLRGATVFKLTIAPNKKDTSNKRAQVFRGYNTRRVL